MSDTITPYFVLIKKFDADNMFINSYIWCSANYTYSSLTNTHIELSFS